MTIRESLFDIAKSYDKILVFGAGGGGDALGALMVWNRLKDLGAQPLLGSVVWERFVIDPFPGPIPLEVMVNADPLGWSIGLVGPDSFANRYGFQVRPQVARVAKYTGGKTIFLDLSKGAEGLLEALLVAKEELGVDAIIGVDTGGDILAKGCEDNLWSPLADALSLYAMAESSIDSYTVVLSPGADGELSEEEVLQRVSEIARNNGLLEVFGLSRKDYLLGKEAEQEVVSEASKIPLRAFEGEYGVVTIRGGTRRVKISPVQSSAYLLDTHMVYKESPLAKSVAGTRGISQASQVLNKYCIVTELDLEQELSRLKEHGSQRQVTLVEVRRSIMNKLIRRGCRPLECGSRD
ncbi:MAG: DUF1152 domain-containing protein [Desulfurococcales archaeon]|nr:DUF1152 domain-containing protein [Desulfurococcales archaeon]